jgi:hypothetical protein
LLAWWFVETGFYMAFAHVLVCVRACRCDHVAGSERRLTESSVESAASSKEENMKQIVGASKGIDRGGGTDV